MIKQKKGKRGGGITKSYSWKQLVNRMDGADASVIRKVNFVGTATTSAAGFSVTQGSCSAMRTLGFEWANLAALYQEYRLLATRIQFTPGAPQAVVAPAVDISSVCFATDRSGALSAPTNVVTAMTLDDFHVYNGQYSGKAPWSATARATDLQNQLFTPVGTTAVTFLLYGVITGDFSVANIAQVFVEWIAEFKGAS